MAGHMQLTIVFTSLLLLLACLFTVARPEDAGWASGSGASSAAVPTDSGQAEPSELLLLHRGCTSFELDDIIAVLARDEDFSPLGSASLQAHLSATPDDDAFRLRILLEPWRGAGYNLSTSARALVSRTLPTSCLTPAVAAAAGSEDQGHLGSAGSSPSSRSSGGVSAGHTSAAAAAAASAAAAAAGDIVLSGAPIHMPGMQRRLQSGVPAAVPVTLRPLASRPDGSPDAATTAARAAGQVTHAAPGATVAAVAVAVAEHGVAPPGAMVAELQVPVSAFTCEVAPPQRRRRLRSLRPNGQQGQEAAAEAAAEEQGQGQEAGEEAEEATRTLFVQLELTVTGPGGQTYQASIGSSYNALPGGCTYASVIASCNPAACTASDAATVRRQRRQLAEAAPAAAAALESLERALGKPLPVSPAVVVAVAAVAASVLVLLPVGALVATGVRRLQLKRREWAAAAAAGGATAAAAAAAIALRRSSAGARGRSRSRNLSRRSSMLGAACEESHAGNGNSSIGSGCSSGGLGSAPPLGGGSTLATAGSGSFSSSGLGCIVGPDSAPVTPMRLSISGAGLPLVQITNNNGACGGSGGGHLTPRRLLHSTQSERSRSPSPGVSPRRVSCNGLIGSGAGVSVSGGLVAAGPGSGTCTPSRLSYMSSGSMLTSATATPRWSSNGSSSRGCSGGSGSGTYAGGLQGRPAFISTSGLPPPGRRYSCSSGSGLAAGSSRALACGGISGCGSSQGSAAGTAAAITTAVASPSSGSSSPALLPRDLDQDGLQLKDGEGRRDVLDISSQPSVPTHHSGPCGLDSPTVAARGSSAAAGAGAIAPSNIGRQLPLPPAPSGPRQLQEARPRWAGSISCKEALGMPPPPPLPAPTHIPGVPLAPLLVSMPVPVPVLAQHSSLAAPVAMPPPPPPLPQVPQT